MFRSSTLMSRKCVSALLKRVFDGLSGEWLLLVLAPQENAGWVIFFRSAWVVFEVVVLIEMSSGLAWAVDRWNEPFLFRFPLLPSNVQSIAAIGVDRCRHISSHYGNQLLTIFGGVYAALYARFASQWAYLAELYNQIKAMQINLAMSSGTATSAGLREVIDLSRSVEAVKSNNCAELLAEWKKGFIEDAFSVHLARKPLFRNVIASWAMDADVKKLLGKDGTSAEVLEGVRLISNDRRVC